MIDDDVLNFLLNKGTITPNTARRWQENADLVNAIRCIREQTLRRVMSMVTVVQPNPPADLGNGLPSAVYRRGHMQARMQIYDEIQQIIAEEPLGPAEYEPEGDAAERVEGD